MGSGAADAGRRVAIGRENVVMNRLLTTMVASGVPWMLAALLLSALAGLASPAMAQEDDAVTAGREALSRRRYPWYDPGKEAPRPRRIGKETATKGSKTGDTQPKPATAPGATGGLGFSLFGSLLQVVGLLVLTAVIVAVAVLIVWAFLRNETTQASGAHVVAASKDVDRVEQLPVALKRGSGSFLDEARRLAAEGNYSEAIVYLYSHLLVELDRHHVIRLAKGKTNRQYLRETRSRPSLAGTLETTMIAFEDVFFGHHPLPRERF